MKYRRELDVFRYKTTSFLFGPRMTGKTTLLHGCHADATFDLLDPRLKLSYKSNPERLWEEIFALPKGAVIIIDEVQRVSALLDYVQMGIDRRDQVFLLSGSSARKLRRGGANLLGGRALDRKLHPLTAKEIGSSFDLNSALQYGTLPKIASLVQTGKHDLAREMLGSYITTYIKEEIQAEALTRNVGAFQRFLAIAVQSQAQVIEFATISRECAVPASTVKEYYQILEDTLIGFLLWPFDANERKKSRPKSYFFDCGVIRAMQNRLYDPPTPQEKGFLFETWFVNELARIRDYDRKPHAFAFWRERDAEVDLLVMQGREIPLAFECKSGSGEMKPGTVRLFHERFPHTRLVVASMTDNRKRLSNDVEILPWQEALNLYRKT